MPELIRLVRISLLLRLIPGVIGVFVALIVFRSALLGALPAVSALFALPVLMWTFLLGRGGRIDHATQRRVLFWMLVSVVAELVFTGIAMRYVLASGLLPAPTPLANVDVDASRFNADAPSLFTLIPTLLGAWLDGRAGARRWWGLQAGLIAVALAVIALVARAMGQPLQLLGVAAAIGQLIVSAIGCYFVANLADSERAERAALARANLALAAQADVREQLAAARERNRLARDLHDTIAHSLAALVVQLDATKAVAASLESRLLPQVSNALEVARTGLRDTRAAIGDLRQTAVQDLGLIGALRKLAEGAQPRTPMRITLELPADAQAGRIAALPAATTEALYLIAQEALENAQRHAQAETLRLVLGMADRSLRLVISDDGGGFDAAGIEDDRFGVRGMRERAEGIGAHLKLVSRPGAGTRIEVELPVPQ